jgi:DNA helicase-2/ATP-dependent DNA helicase PcrA
MNYYADLHIHSRYSRATSPQCDLEHLWLWAQIKGIRVVATGDCIHPGWFAELQQKLIPADDGFLTLKPEYAAAVESEAPAACRADVRFILSTEISSIYKRGGKVRKVHNVVYFPDFATAARVQARLEAIGNIRSDGRPILGLDSRDLLAIVLDSHRDAFLIPAHIWTPWFSALGSKSGFDSIEECFGDLTKQIFAVETGLSSDPLMNWRLRSLDPFVMVSNSDAHSPNKLGREANCFDTDCSYQAMLSAMRDPADKGMTGTIEFFPEEGKYHYDGHRKCGQRLHPVETARTKGLCPVCGKPVTVGVMARVEELADRPEGERAPRSRPYRNLIPLTEIIGESFGVGPASGRVDLAYQRLVAALGSEFAILQTVPLDQIEKTAGSMVGEGIRRVRDGRVELQAGYDGDYGIIRIFTDQERTTAKEQQNLFGSRPDTVSSQKKKAKTAPHKGKSDADKPADSPLLPPLIAAKLNDAQQAAVDYRDSHLMIIAGPGTGKTHTLISRIEATLALCQPHEKILAITFTCKAAEEMRSRIGRRIGEQLHAQITVGTFHQFCLELLRRYSDHVTMPPAFSIAADDDRETIARQVWPDLSAAQRREMLAKVSRLKAVGGDTDPAVQNYTHQLRQAGLLDFDDLLTEAVRLLADSAVVRADVRRSYRYVFVDEYQDINPIQHELLTLLVADGVTITAIGDPNQAIYGFRGADVSLFGRFGQSFTGAKSLYLADNYRTAANLLSACGHMIGSGGSTAVPSLNARMYREGRLTVHAAPTDKAEAEYVVHQIEKMVGGTSMFSQDSGRVDSGENAERSFADFAVLYRLNAQRHALVEALERSGIPYHVAGDTPLGAHPFVVDTLTMLRLAAGVPVSADAIGRCMQRFVYGLGETGRDAIVDELNRSGTTIAQINALPASNRIIEPVRQGVVVFGAMLTDLQRCPTVSLRLDIIETWPGFGDALSRDTGNDALWRRLRRIASITDDPIAYIDYLLLQREADGVEFGAEKVSLMTLHAAKGLEFGVVFICGCEAGILPLDLPGKVTDCAEERRLFYVGMTRAKERLYLLRSQRRPLFGRFTTPLPSPFLADIQEEMKTYEEQSRVYRAKKMPESEQLSLF